MVEINTNILITRNITSINLLVSREPQIKLWKKQARCDSLCHNSSTLGSQGRQITLSPGVGEQPGQHGKTLFLLKIQKLVRYVGAHL